MTGTTLLFPDLRNRRADDACVLLLRALAGIAALLLLLGCQNQGIPTGKTEEAAHKPAVTATLNPLGVLIQDIAGDRLSVTTLLKPGQSEHTFEPKPSDVATIRKSIAFFHIGTVDRWAEGLTAPNKIDLLTTLPADRFLDASGHEHHHHDHEHDEHCTTGVDGHIWMDPALMADIIPAIAAELSLADPAGAAIFEANSRRVTADLKALDEQLSASLAPHRGRAVFTFHPSHRYMLRRYGLEEGGTITPFPGQEPSPAYVAELLGKLRQQGAGAIFTEPQLPRRPAEAIARAANLRLLELDPIGGTPGRITYADLLRYNATTLAEGLAVPPPAP